MSEKEKKQKAAPYQSPWPSRPERPWERPWPPPTPMPIIPTEDVIRVLKQILDRLSQIEKRLERIETLFAEKSVSPE
ncbi:MAG: hypothetical protein JSV85_03020 [Candidatus Bathyarchaeota archaeon]|nr:MAG: hypothetical protein JSV85_03020 [Candidatus Bathyarchaeota archaeon]